MQHSEHNMSIGDARTDMLCVPVDDLYITLNLQLECIIILLITPLYFLTVVGSRYGIIINYDSTNIRRPLLFEKCLYKIFHIHPFLS